MSQEIGYARVSKMEQHLALQLDALKKRGVVRVFTEKQTGIRFDSKAFLAAMEFLNEGDTLVVWNRIDLDGHCSSSSKRWKN
jgi:DNA invertase Pin-like site-specific DNA recombinase